MRHCRQCFDPFDNPHDAREDRYKYESLTSDSVDKDEFVTSDELNEASQYEEVSPYDFDFDFGT